MRSAPSAERARRLLLAALGRVVEGAPGPRQLSSSSPGSSLQLLSLERGIGKGYGAESELQVRPGVPGSGACSVLLCPVDCLAGG